MPAGRDAKGKRTYATLTNRQLNADVDRYARGLLSLGVARGAHAALMVRPSLEFFAQRNLERLPLGRDRQGNGIVGFLPRRALRRASHPAELLALRLLQATGLVCFWTASTALGMSTAQPNRMGMAMGFLGMTGSVGGLLAGATRWRDKSGDGIAVASALAAADSILGSLS